MTRTIKLGFVVAAIVAVASGSTQAGFQTQAFDWIMQAEQPGQIVPETWTGYLVLPFKGDGTGSPLDVVVLTSPTDFPGTSINGSLMDWNTGAGGSFTVKDGSIISGGFGAVENNGGLSFTSIELEDRGFSFFSSFDYSQKVPQGFSLMGGTQFTAATPEPGSFTVFCTIFLAAGGWSLLKRRPSGSASANA
jgi:hypothetical protein